jgi:hypothetical protein
VDAGVPAAQFLGVALRQSPRAVSLVVPAEFVALGRMAVRFRPITHDGQFCRTEQL